MLSQFALIKYSRDEKQKLALAAESNYADYFPQQTFASSEFRKYDVTYQRRVTLLLDND